MRFTKENAVSIAQLVFYAPSLVTSILLCVRLTWHPFGGWFFLFLFSLIRIAGASVDLATIGGSSLKSLHIAAVTISFIGISSLLLTTLGLIIRIRRVITEKQPTSIRPLYLGVAWYCNIASFVLYLRGGVFFGEKMAKVGSILTQVGVGISSGALLLILVITCVLHRHRSHADIKEQALHSAVLASMPFLLVRLLHAALVAFYKRKGFNVDGGDIIPIIFMSMMPEIIVVFIYTVVGFRLRRLPMESCRKRKHRKCQLWQRFASGSTGNKN
jgi:hypothetical protein